MNRNFVRTLVIDGVANGKDPENGGKDRGSRRVLSCEVLGLQSPKARLRSWPLGKLRVKVDEGGETSSRTSGLYREKTKKDAGGQKSREFLQRRILETYEESRRSDLWWDDTTKIATNEGGMHGYF